MWRHRRLLIYPLLLGAVASIAMALHGNPGRWLGTAGLLLDIAGLLQLEISGVFSRAMELYADEKLYPKGVFDDRVERSLAMRAIGYSYHAEEVFHYQGEIVRAEVIKHVPPDPVAAVFWLCNRRPDRWRSPERWRRWRSRRSS